MWGDKLEYLDQKSAGRRNRQGIVEAKKERAKRTALERWRDEEKSSRKDLSQAKEFIKKGVFKPRNRSESPPPKKYRDKTGRNKGSARACSFCRPTYCNRVYKAWEITREAKDQCDEYLTSAVV